MRLAFYWLAVLFLREKLRGDAAGYEIQRMFIELLAAGSVANAAWNPLNTA